MHRFHPFPLLVSVVSGDEVECISQIRQLSIVDVKAPIRGPLGRADQHDIESVIERVNGRWPVSAAFGELVDLPESVCLSIEGLKYAKIGLSNTGPMDWRARWESFCRSLAKDCLPVAVVYADWESCGAPEPIETIKFGCQVGCQVAMIDTFDKRGGSTFQQMDANEIRRIQQHCTELQMQFVLAGGIQTSGDLAKAAILGPDWVGVRSAVCGPDRTAPISPEYVTRFQTRLGEVATQSPVSLFQSPS